MSFISNNKRTGLLIKTKSPGETRKVGRIIGELLEEGDIITLYGDLGSGKTCLVQGMSSGAGVKEKYITSPTFIIINEYMGRIPFYHIDLYRIGSSEIEELGLREYIYSEGVTVIEWADRAGEELPEERLSIYLKITSKRSREIRFKGKGERYINLIEIVKEKVIPPNPPLEKGG